MPHRPSGSIAALLPLLVATWMGGCTATGSSDSKPTVEADGENSGSDRKNRRDGGKGANSSGDGGIAADGEVSSAEDVENSSDLEDRTDTDRFVGDASADGDTDSGELDGGDEEATDGEDDDIGEDGRAAVCGDGVVEGGEACDDGNTQSGDYCSADCSTVTGECGDGIVQDNESCDDGSITSDCDTYHDGGDGTCLPPGECSDGYVLENGTCVDEQIDEHVHIYVTNTCQLSVQPQSVTVPRGRTVSFVYHNHSSSYSVDVWLSYIGGYTDLKRGATWDDSFVHCRNGNRPYDAYADITINGLSLDDSHCPGHRMMIECE